MTYEEWLKSKGIATIDAPVISSARKRRQYEDLAPVALTKNELGMGGAPTKNEWLQSGALTGGATKENVSKAILGTGTDVSGDLLAGVIGAGENVLDAIVGAAGNVGAFLGADKFAEKTEAFVEKQLYDPDEVAKTILSGLNSYGFASSSNMGMPVSFSAKDNEWRDKGQEAAKNYVFNTAEADSVLGTKADALVQSIGQQLASRTLGAVGVPWELTMALTSFGAEMDNALNNGATMGEAGASAAVSAAAEILGEKLFSGGIIGAKGLFGNNAKEAASALGKGIAVNLWNTAKGYAKDMGEEAIEEVFSEVVSRLGTAIYKADSPEALGKLMTDKAAWQDYLDAAIGGGIMGGLASGKKAVTSAATGRSYETGLTQNEQKVFKAEYNSRIAEAKKKGEVSKESKQEIYDNVLRDIQNGRIHTDTIEKVLGGKDYTAYETSVKNEADLKQKLEAAQKEYDDLMHGDITEEVKLAKEQEIADLEAQLESKAAETAKNTLSDNVFKMVAQDANLRESYYERGRRSQKFEADVSKYKDGAKEIVQKAIDSGILNNTRATHDLVDFVAKAAPKVGTTFNWTDNAKLAEAGYALEGKVVNGYVDKDGITLNVDSNKALNTVVGHEITHVLEGTELYNKLSEAVVQYAKTKGDYDTRLEEITKLYNGVETSDVNRELVADLVGNYLFTDSKFLDQLAQNQNLFQKIWSEVKYLYNIANAGSDEAKQLLEVKRAFERAWNGGKGKAVEGTKYSLSDAKIPTWEELKQKPAVKVVDISTPQTNGTFAERRAQIRKNLSDVISKPYLNKDTGTMIFLTEKSYAHAFNNLGEIQLNAAEHFPELIENAILTHSEPPTHGSEHANGVYTFFAAVNADGVKPVKLKVKEYTYSGQDLPKNIKAYFDGLPEDYAAAYDTVVLGVEEIEKSPSGSAKDMSPKDSFLSPDELPTINVADLLGIVKGDAEKYIPQHSLSTDSDIAPIGNFNVYGKDVKLSEDIATVADNVAPVAEDIAPVKTTGKPEKITTAQDRAKAQLDSAYTEISSLGNLREASIQDFNDEIAELESEYASKKNKNTKVANDILRRIERVKSMRDSVDADYAKRISDVESRIAKLSNATYSTAMQRKAKQEEYRNFIEKLVGDTSTWVDKKLGIQYQTNTFKRNLRDIVRNADGSRNIEKADAIYDALQGTYNKNEAKLNRRANEIKKQFADLKLTNAEDVYVQMLGELRHNPETTLSKEVVDDYYEQHKDKINTDKVDKAIDMARELYDGLYAELNAVLREQGMKELPYRKGYFPHFTEEKQNIIAKLFNWKNKNNKIPTDIAGLTEEFKPNKRWVSFDKRRTSDVTDYNFSKGLDGYVSGALDLIYHTEDIQKRRAFENYIRYTHSEEGVKEKIKAIRDNDEYDANEMQMMIDAVYGEAKNPLNNFVTDLRTGTNLLAGKKHSLDRTMEQIFSREVYSFVDQVYKRTTANMIAGSVSSAMTNFIPITQSWGEVSPVYSMKAMRDTVKNTFNHVMGEAYVDDGVIDKSDFLTNRLNANENLYKGVHDKISDAAGMLMEVVDSFTSQTVWRSKYMQNIDNGMSESEAIHNADEFAAGLMADRSRGNMPTIFESKSPVTKMFTAFQLEVANQYNYMFKDMPQNMQDETTAQMVKGYALMAVGAYMYNALYSAMVGRDAAFDPIGMIAELIAGLRDEDEENGDVWMRFAQNAVEEIPFVGGLIGGGRIPVSSAIPYGGNAMEFLTDALNGNGANIWKETKKSAYYLLPPVMGGQLKKMNEGMAMFSDDLPIAGSYTTSGNLRFSVEDTPQNRLQAALFGQYASKNARQYFDENRTPLGEKQIQELVDVEMPIADYWKYRDGLKDQEKIEDKFDYIAGLDLPVAKKNILINNVVDRKTPVDLSNYDDFADYEEFDFYTKNTAKYNFLKDNGVSYQKYKADEVDKANYDNDYSWYKNNPDKVAVANLITGNVIEYRNLLDELGNLPAKEQKVEYINNLDMDYGKKIILYRSLYSSQSDKQTYNKPILDYLFAQSLPSDQLNSILKTLGFIVKDGYVSW